MMMNIKEENCMSIKAIGVITKFNTSGKICIRTENTCYHNGKAYNFAISEDAAFEIKALSPDMEFGFNESLAVFLSMIALQGAKAIFEFDKDLKKIVAVEIHNE